LYIYIEVPRTSGMTDVIVKVMVEVLCIHPPFSPTTII